MPTNHDHDHDDDDETPSVPPAPAPPTSPVPSAATAQASPPTWRTSWRALFGALFSIRPPDVMRLVLLLLAFGGGMWLIWISWAALWPFQVGLVLAYVLIPLVDWLTAYMRRWIAIVLVYSAGIVALVIVIGVVVPLLAAQTTSLLNSLPNASQFSTQIDSLTNNYDDLVQRLPDDIRATVEEEALQVFNALRDNLLVYAQSVAEFLFDSVIGIFNTFSFLLGFVILPFWLFYVLSDQKRWVRGLNEALPQWVRDDFWAVLRIIDRVFSSYIRGQLFLGATIAIVSYLGLTLLQLLGFGGINFKLVLAAFAGVMELVPFIGPIIGAVPAIVVGALHSWQTALAIGILYLIIQQIEGNVLVPRVVGESVNLHPALVMILIVIFSQFGFFWIIISAPLAGVVRDLYQYVYGRFRNPPSPAGVLPREDTDLDDTHTGLVQIADIDESSPQTTG